MKRFILDTNILLKDPSLISRWNSTYKILIPDLVIQETVKVSGRVRGVENILHEVDEAESKGFLKVIKTSPDNYKYTEELSERRISFVDYQVAQLAKEYSKDRGDDVYLVSDDRVLLRYAEEIGVKALNLISFQSLVNSLKTVALNQVPQNKTIESYQLKHLSISFISGILLSLITFVAYENIQTILSYLPVWGSLTIVIVTPFVFYWFRSNRRIAYSITEFLVGLYASYYGVKPLIESFDINGISDLKVVIPVLGGIYVMVRGLDNFSKGIKGTSLEIKWKKIFKN